MIILGICNASVGGACIIRDGELLVSINEERFTRIKNHRIFPHQSIDFCLARVDITLEQVDYVACGAWGGIDANFLPRCFLEMSEASARPVARKLFQDRVDVAVERDRVFKDELIERVLEMGVRREKLFFYDHHLSHAATAFYPSPFEEALVVTADGRGDFKSATVYHGSRSAGLKHLNSTSMFNSLGAFYGFITRFLGFVPDRHEGKVTGLAAIGNPQACIDVLRSMIDYRDDSIKADLGVNYTPFMTGSLPELERKLEKYSREDIAAAAQYLLEDIMLKYIGGYLQQTGLRTVAVSGGIFGNVKLNERILELAGVDNIYVFPQMGDGGSAVGGALLKLYEAGGAFDYPLKHVYLGAGFSTAEILATLEKYRDKLDWQSLDDYTLDRLADELHGGAVIGLFAGRMEYGPRALGARSIIARATEKSINDILNARLNRSEFMPFAPVTLKNHAAESFKGWNESHLAAEFMTVCYKCTDRFIEQSPATVHVDNTARPQVIDGTFNRLYFDILTTYYRKTGIPTLVNTSFNNHEEPIVCTPEDAIQSLLLDNVDFVVMENHVVKPRAGSSN